MRMTNPAPNSPRFPACLVVFVLLAACGDAGGPRDPAEDIPLNAVTEEVYTVGSVAGDDWDTFGSVRSVHFDAEANLHIFDDQASHIHVVGSDGLLVRTVGGSGEGPGELNGPMSLIVARDGSYTVMAVGQIDLFEPGGEYAKRITVNMFTTGWVMADRALPDSRLLTTTILRVSDDDEEEDEEGRPIYIFPLHGADPELLYTAWKLPEDDEEAAVDIEEGVIRMSAGRAFEPRLDYEVLTDGRLALIDSIGYRIKLVGLDGSVTAAVERPIAPLPVDDAIMEAERERFREVMAELEESRAALNLGMRFERPGAEARTFADEVPVLFSIKADWADRIWAVRRDPTGGGEGPTDIVTPAGDYIGTLPPDGLRTPDAFGPDGLMAFIDTDEFDVPAVRVVRLIRLEPVG